MYNQGDKKLIICEKNIDNDYFLQFENNDPLLFLYSEYNIRCYANYKVYSVKCFVQCKVQYKDWLSGEGFDPDCMLLTVYIEQNKVYSVLRTNR